eukprot:1161259-Pelagomonas_calceolata.AAC.6
MRMQEGAESLECEGSCGKLLCCRYICLIGQDLDWACCSEPQNRRACLNEPHHYGFASYPGSHIHYAQETWRNPGGW